MSASVPDRAFVPAASSPQAVSPVPASIPCAEDLAYRLQIAEESLEYLADILAASAFDAERGRTSKSERQRQIKICDVAIAALNGERVLTFRSEPQRVIGRLQAVRDAIAAIAQGSAS